MQNKISLDSIPCKTNKNIVRGPGLIWHTSMWVRIYKFGYWNKNIGHSTFINSPIVCAVLALDSWNNCSGEQARQPNIRKIVQSSLHSWTIYIIKENKVLPPYVNSLATRWHMLGIPLPLNQWSLAQQTLRRSCLAVGSALQRKQ